MFSKEDISEYLAYVQNVYTSFQNLKSPYIKAGYFFRFKFCKLNSLFYKFNWVILDMAIKDNNRYIEKKKLGTKVLNNNKKLLIFPPLDKIIRQIISRAI